MRADRKASVLPRIALVAGGVALMLAVVELGSRLAGLDPGVGALSSDTCLQRSALLGEEFRPRCRGVIGSAQFETSSLGLRGPELRADGSVRILALGDSCTWGWGVGQDESWPAELQRLLDTRAQGPPYEVINAGVPGYTVHQGLLYLRERGLSLHPDIVTIAYGFNDMAAVGNIEVMLQRNRQLLPLLRFDDWLTEWSTGYRWLRLEPNPQLPRNKPRRVGPSAYERDLNDVVRLVHDTGAKPFLLTFARVDGRDEYSAAEDRIARAYDVPHVGYSGPRFDVVHPTPEGYRVIAGQLLRQFEEHGYLD